MLVALGVAAWATATPVPITPCGAVAPSVVTPEVGAAGPVDAPSTSPGRLEPDAVPVPPPFVLPTASGPEIIPPPPPPPPPLLLEATAGLETVPARVPLVPVPEEETPLEESVPVTTEALAIELPANASTMIHVPPTSRSVM